MMNRHKQFLMDFSDGFGLLAMATPKAYMYTPSHHYSVN